MNVGVIEAAAGSMLWKFDMVEQTKRHGCNSSDRNISGLSFLMLFPDESPQSLTGPSSPQTYCGSMCVLSAMVHDRDRCRCLFDLDSSATGSDLGPDRHHFRDLSRSSSASLAAG